jgi:hypothetical protein
MPFLASIVSARELSGETGARARREWIRERASERLTSGKRGGESLNAEAPLEGDQPRDAAAGERSGWDAGNGIVGRQGREPTGVTNRRGAAGSERSTAFWKGKALKGESQERERHETRPRRPGSAETVKRSRKPEGGPGGGGNPTTNRGARESLR